MSGKKLSLFLAAVIAFAGVQENTFISFAVENASEDTSDESEGNSAAEQVEVTGDGFNTSDIEADAAAQISGDATEDTYAVEATVTYGQTEARTILNMINELRTGEDAWYWASDNTTKVECSNLSELTYDYDLEAIAMQRAAEIALSYSHTRPDGTLCITAYDETTLVYTAAGENIAAGYTSAGAVFVGWEEADADYSGQDHRRNMLSSDFTAVGIGHVYYNGYHYWVMELAQTTNASTPTTANDSDTTVAINVLASNLSSVSFTTDPASYELIVGDTADLPTLTAEISLSGTWPNQMQPVSVNYKWSISDTTYATLFSGQIIAKIAGTTSLVSTVLGQNVEVPINVAYDLKKGSASLSEKSYTYDGTAKTPDVIVTYNSETLTADTDYTVMYSDNTEVGTASVAVTGMGAYTGTINLNFTIEATSLSDASVILSSTSYEYDGTEKEPAVTVKYDTIVLTKGIDYTVAYSDNVEAGVATVTITGIGNYSGTITQNYNIIGEETETETESETETEEATEAESESETEEQEVKNGLVRDDDGNWFYYVDGAVDTDFAGIAVYNGGLFFVANGQIVTDATGLNEYGGSWYYLANGQIVTSYTGLVLYDGSWFYITAGVLDTAKNGLVAYDGETFLVAEGQLLTSYNGLWQNATSIGGDGNWYFIGAGMVQNVSQVASYDGAFFVIENGMLDSDYNGTIKYDGSTFIVVNGQLY